VFYVDEEGYNILTVGDDGKWENYS
jgi:hypothetical protein